MGGDVIYSIMRALMAVSNKKSQYVLFSQSKQQYRS